MPILNLSAIVRGAAMINEYQLLARRSMIRATLCDSIGAMDDANRVKQMFTQLNDWTRHYNEEILNGKWSHFFNWQPYHWFRSEKIEQPIATPELISKALHGLKPRFLSVSDALSCEGALIDCDKDGEIPIWVDALTPVRNFSKETADNIFCHIYLHHSTITTQQFDASAAPINNIWHATYIGPMWSRVGTLNLKKGENHLYISNLKSDAHIDHIFLGIYPPFVREPRLRIPAYDYLYRHESIERIPQLGFSDGMMVQSFDTPSYQQPVSAPYVEYEIDLLPNDSVIEIRTLPTLHVYDGRDARFAIQLGNESPTMFSIHANDFTAEWRWNVLRGYASRSIPVASSGRQRLRIYLIDPGIVLQELLVHSKAIR